jgi:hypothetical protein
MHALTMGAGHEPHVHVRLEVAGIDTTHDNYEGALYDAGCNDALIAVVDGVVFLDFDREGPSFQQAVVSATDAVQAADGKVVRVMPTPE